MIDQQTEQGDRATISDEAQAANQADDEELVVLGNGRFAHPVYPRDLEPQPTARKAAAPSEVRIIAFTLSHTIAFLSGVVFALGLVAWIQRAGG